MAQRKADIEISGSGFYSLFATTKRGCSWMNKNVYFEPWQIQSPNGIVCDDTGMVQDIAEGAIAKGLLVLVNGRRYLGDNKVA
jgi:hypothetical protein